MMLHEQHQQRANVPLHVEEEVLLPYVQPCSNVAYKYVNQVAA